MKRTKTMRVSPITLEMISWRRMLAAKPQPNLAAEIVEESATRVRVAIRLKMPKWLVPPLTLVVKPRRRRIFELDPVGVEVWRACDGQRTVEEIVEAFAEQHALTFHEARVAVTNFLHSLIQRGLIAIEQTR